MKIRTIIATFLAVVSSATMAFANVPMPKIIPVSYETAVPVDTDMEIGTETNIDTMSPLGPSLGVFKLTSYCTGHCCNGKWGNITALGTKITPHHTIAVDRRVIPLGTWVYINIPGQGWQKFLAEDIGGGVKGNHIDIAVQNHNETFTPAYNGYAEVRIALA